MSAPDRLVIRSYQRIFRPDRRIYQVEGHQLPVPGGVPLAWLGWFVAALLTVLLLGGRSLVLSVLLALAAAVVGRALGGSGTAVIFGTAVLAGTQVLGLLLGVIDWPLRLVVLPAAVAMLAGQATPDGRPAHRYVRSWLAWRLRPGRRSLGRPLPPAGVRRLVGGAIWAAPDHHRVAVRRGRISGPATVHFRDPMAMALGRTLGRTRRIVRPVTDQTPTAACDVVLAFGERLEVRP